MRAGRRPSFDHDAAVAAYLADESLSTSAVGRRFGVTRFTIWHVLRSRGISTRPAVGAMIGRPRSFDHDKAVETYLADENLSASALARRLGVTRHAICNVLRSRGIRPRNPNGTPPPAGIVPREEFARLYNEMSVRKLAEHLGCSEWAIWYRARNMQLKNPRRRA